MDIMANTNDLDLDNISPDRKKQGEGWFAVLNVGPQPKISDIRLMHHLAHESVVSCVRFSADGKYFATGCNNTAQIYDASTGEKLCVFSHGRPALGRDMYIRSVCFSPDGNYLATGGEDGKVNIWNISTRVIDKVFEGHGQEIYSLVYSPNGRYIISGSGDNTVRVWDLLDNGSPKVLPGGSTVHSGGITSVAVSPDGRFIAAGTLENDAIIWNAETSTLVGRSTGHTSSVYNVNFTPDGKGLITGSLDKSLRHWDIAGLLEGHLNAGTGSVLQELQGHRDYVLCASISQDGSLLASGSKDRRAHLWDMKTGSKVLTLLGHRNSVIGIDLSPMGNLLATASGDWSARIWNYRK